VVKPPDFQSGDSWVQIPPTLPNFVVRMAVRFRSGLPNRRLILGTDDLDELAGKMYVLEDFVRRLKENPAAVERILKVGSSDDVTQAFKMCEAKFKEV
jgi:hypothetical protein